MTYIIRIETNDPKIRNRAVELWEVYEDKIIKFSVKDTEQIRCHYI